MIISDKSRLNTARAAYIHVPFCISKCAYCDFNSFAGKESIFNDYTIALIKEIKSTNIADNQKPLKTVYFGGGTPTILEANQLVSILNQINTKFGIEEHAEITIEANPGTIDIDKLKTLRKAGFNRLSIGVQSFDDSYLKMLGRTHNSKDVFTAFEIARKAGFDNISMDLIFGLPNQTLENWKTQLNKAIELEPSHISAYELTIEENTPLYNAFKRNEYLEIDSDLQIEMFEYCSEFLTNAGYEHYEVSNYAKPGLKSKHNQIYWKNLPYYGFGASAVSYINGVRAKRIDNPEDYIAAMNKGNAIISESETIEGIKLISETIMLGLRMKDGINIDEINSRFGIDILNLFNSQIITLKEKHLIPINENYLRTTLKGFHLLNDVITEFF
jgi:oxygen-independent coproporphyrinogen III oxidase